MFLYLIRIQCLSGATLRRKGSCMEIISPKYDFCMKELLAREVIRKFFISDVLDIPVEEIRSVRLMTPFLLKRSKKQKQGIVDVLVDFNNDTKINIELQVRCCLDWDRRNLFYLARMFTGDLRAGDDYSELKRCVGISILDFNLTESGQYHSIYRLRDENGNEFSDLFELHIIELGKRLTGTDRIDDWIRLFNARSEEELNMIGAKNPGIKAAIEEIRSMSFGARMKWRYEARQKELRDQRAQYAYERLQGMEEGIMAFIEDNLEEGRSEEVIIDKLMRRFSLRQDKARSYLCKVLKTQELSK